MGIYDREYYRDDSGGSGIFGGPNPATRTLIAINVIVFVIEVLGNGEAMILGLGARSGAIFQGLQLHRLLTASFVHNPNDLLSIVFQMLILYWVGREMEAIYGSREFTWAYLLACVFSTLAWALFDYFGPGEGRGLYFGPSGAIAAILVLFTLYYPQREILLFFIIPVKMWILLVVFLGFDVIQLIGVIQANRGGGIPPGSTIFFGHLAGAAYGWAYKAWDIRWTRWLNFKGFSRGPRYRVVAPEPTERPRSGPARPAPSGGFTEELLDAQVDDILAKIAREGPGSLSSEEKRILEEASRRAKSRRSGRLS